MEQVPRDEGVCLRRQADKEIVDPGFEPGLWASRRKYSKAQYDPGHLAPKVNPKLGMGSRQS